MVRVKSGTNAKNLKSTWLKSKIRKEIRQKLNNQTETQRLRKSSLIKEKLFKLAEFKKAKCVLFYLAKDKEVETRFMITEAQKIGKKVLVPKILVREKIMIPSLMENMEEELTPGPYGILEVQAKYVRKIPSEKIDLVVVPGLAFDQHNRRLGRGRGYYDKFLKLLSSRTPCIGLAFDFQILDRLPFFSHDISVTKVISA